MDNISMNRLTKKFNDAGRSSLNMSQLIYQKLETHDLADVDDFLNKEELDNALQIGPRFSQNRGKEDVHATVH